MGIVVFLVTFLFLLYIGKIKNGTINNPLTYYLTFWCGWILISLFNPYNLYPVSDRAYMYIWINVFFFSTGYIIVSKRNKTTKFVDLIWTHKLKKFILLIQIVILVILVYYNFKYAGILNSRLITDARIITLEVGYLFSRYTEYLIFHYFITAILNLLIIISISKFFIDGKITKSLILTLINTILFSFIGLGRFVVFNTLIFFILSAFLRKKSLVKEIKKSDKTKHTNKSKYYIAFTLIIGFIMIQITAQRTGGTITDLSSLIFWLSFSIKQGITYFVGPFRAFDSFLYRDIIHDIGYTLGRSTFSGIEEIFNNALILAGIEINTANSILSSFTREYISIGFDNQYFNAFYTGLTNFYLDGGLAFIMLYSFLFGSILGLTWNVYNAKPNIATLSLLVFISKTTLSYLYRWDYSIPVNWIILVFLMIYTIKLNGKVHES